MTNVKKYLKKKLRCCFTFFHKFVEKITIKNAICTKKRKITKKFKSSAYMKKKNIWLELKRLTINLQFQLK